MSSLSETGNEGKFQPWDWIIILIGLLVGLAWMAWGPNRSMEVDRDTLIFQMDWWGEKVR